MSAMELQVRLLEELGQHAYLTIAVSGGIGSMTPAYVAHRLSPHPVTMVHAISPAVPPKATDRVRAYAAREGWDLSIVDAGEFSDPAYRANPVARCYYCKSHLYDPKDGIRAIARGHGLQDISDLPAQPCLASRVETEPAEMAFIDQVDCGVAGLWWLLERLPEINAHDIVIVVAGLDAVLASVLGGLTPRPLLAGPTSVGYGVANQGEAARHSMLASCAPGIGVFNIDNGYGAACAAARIVRRLSS